MLTGALAWAQSQPIATGVIALAVAAFFYFKPRPALKLLLLVVGLGLDYSLFFNRLSHSVEEWTTTFKALWVCCITTVLVFGMLMLSHTPPLQAVGLTVSIGAGLCLVFGAVWSTAVPRKR